MKDRAALGMIEWAEQEHGLSLGAEIIISTSGNLGIGMAMTCAVKGYQLICLVTPAITFGRLLGATLAKGG